MLSSTIGELKELRARLEEALENSGAAAAWRFEVHAVAAGAAPSEQYLGIARTCDVYVLIVADQQSSATEAEYEVAYADNPHKVLPFFLGAGSAGVGPFRALIQDRHTRVKRDSADDLVQPIYDAIVEWIATGKAVHKQLIADLEQRIERARTAIADVPLILEPRVTLEENEHPVSEVIRGNSCVALMGIGGSGKTMGAVVAARRAARDGRTLPVYSIARENQVDPIGLIRERMDAVHFHASAELVEQWCRDGRVLLLVDGVEGLTASTRRLLMTGLSQWAERFPRSGVVVCARNFSSLEVHEFTRAAAAPLADTQMQDLLQAFGATDQTVRFSEQVRDIARWPMWATALIVYGSEARTGLDLLQKLVTTRLQTAGMSSAIEEAELRAAASYCAHRLWPATVSSAAHVLEVLTSWRTSEVAATAFVSRPAEDVLGRLEQAALLEIGDEVAFPHRLIATILAAEHAVSSNAERADPELAPFVAALADDDRHPDLLHRTIMGHSIFTLARYLRLSPSRGRRADPQADVSRLADAYRRWSAPQEELDLVMSSNWIAWRPASIATVRTCEDDGYEAWRSESDEAVQFWPTLPFGERSPEFIAAVYVLGRFRTRVLGLDPGGAPAATVTERDVQVLMRDEATLRLDVVRTLHDIRDARLELLGELGLDTGERLAPPSGEPQVTIWTPPGQSPSVHVAWGGDRPRVVIGSSAPRDVPGVTTSLRHLLDGLARKVAFDDLERDIEEELGCRLSAQNWSRPELVPAWAW